MESEYASKTRTRRPQWFPESFTQADSPFLFLVVENVNKLWISLKLYMKYSSEYTISVSRELIDDFCVRSVLLSLELNNSVKSI